MGNNNSNCVTITPQTPTQSNGDVNNNANNNKNVLVSFINGEKSILARRGRKYADQLLDDLKLKVCKLEPEQIVTKVEDKVLAELQSNQRYRQLITKPLWKESIQSLKPQDIIYRLGESKSGLNANFEGPPQSYEELKQRCLQDGTLFEDNTFPASDASFYMHGRGPRRFKWLRPHEISDDPKFFNEGAERFDVCQGEIGNCWLLAAVANLTLNKRFLERVVPHDQTFDKPNYCGIFHFRFWQYGKWIDVVVDDRLPTVNGKLMLMHSKDRNEFWSALLEKAYAKLHGSYESLKGGTTSEAMEDFTGGLTEHYEIQSDECPPNLFTVMLKAFQRNSFMGCSIAAADSSQMEAVLPNGLIKGHAYSITSVKFVQIDHLKVQGKIPLIRIRNPWGNEAEWNGAWSDKSREWAIVSESEKRMLGITFDSDGEFWMSFADFKSNFTNIEITNLTPDSLDDDQKRRWEVNYFEGQWIPGVSAGGCRNNINTFYTNPQYMITLVDHDDEDEDDLCTCVVALMQKNHRIKRKMGLDNLTIGFAIYEVKDNALGLGVSPRLNYSSVPQVQALSTNFFRYNASVARSATFINLREISGRFRLKPGRYCIIPSTFEPNQKGDFMIRFFTEKPAKNVVENDDEVTEVGGEDGNKENGDMIYNGPVINEQVISNIRPDPLPDDRYGGGGNNGDPNANMNIIELLTMCLSLVNLARQWYQAVNEKPDVAEAAPKVQSTGGDRTDNEKSAFQFFQKIAGEDLEVDALELQKIVNHVFKKELKFEGFSTESCRSMVALMDFDESGKLGFDEFVQLWRHLKNWCEIFKKHDVDGSSTIQASELREAFREVGINVNRQILRMLVNRFGHHKKSSATLEDQLYFDDFICCSLKMKRCIEVWNNKKNKGISLPGAFSIFARSAFDRIGNVGNESSFTLDEFMRNVDIKI
ncbi:Calpain-1 catalytic subunit [Blomia tropicalis]|nr:Calpain-1 catalytic subunit [Blomia tropicalis]